MPLGKPSRKPKNRLSPISRLANDSQGSWVLSLRSAKATETLGEAIGHHLCGGEIIALQGDLGAGKTVLVKGIATGSRVSPDHVTSPTFTLVHVYSGNLRLVHADLYRIKSVEELPSIGLEEYYDSSTAVVIEWADRMGSHIPNDSLTIHLAHTQRHTRLATLRAHGPRSRALLQKVKRELEASLTAETSNR